jgi:hypothetical protein
MTKVSLNSPVKIFLRGEVLGVSLARIRGVVEVDSIIGMGDRGVVVDVTEVGLRDDVDVV